MKRVLVFLNPNCDAKDAGGAAYHVCQSLIAVGTGGLTGRGYMEGVQKLFFLPEAHTDFIFANIAEEWGFIGSVIILLLFAIFGFRGLRTVFRSQDPFARLTAFGITTAPGPSSLLQHERSPLAAAHQRHSAAADLLGWNVALCNSGQHRRPAQHQQKSGLKAGTRD